WRRWRIPDSGRRPKKRLAGIWIWNRFDTQHLKSMKFSIKTAGGCRCGLLAGLIKDHRPEPPFFLIINLSIFQFRDVRLEWTEGNDRINSIPHRNLGRGHRCSIPV